jgi:hypothetical protein
VRCPADEHKLHKCRFLKTENWTVRGLGLCTHMKKRNKCPGTCWEMDKKCERVYPPCIRHAAQMLGKATKIICLAKN